MITSSFGGVFRSLAAVMMICVGRALSDRLVLDL